MIQHIFQYIQTKMIDFNHHPSPSIFSSTAYAENTLASLHGSD